MGLGDWYADRGTWEVGEPTSGPGSAYSGQNCVATVLGGNYHNNVSSRLISPSFVVPSAIENPRLRFWQWYSIVYGDDQAFVQIRVGTGNWQTISETYVNTGGGIWTYPSIDLSAYSDSTVQIAFYFVSGNYNVSSGWYVDDIAIITGPIVYNNPESWEMGLGDWYGDRGTWEVGEPTSGPGSAYSGQNCVATVLGGNYHGNVSSRLISPSFTLPGVSENPALTFWHWYSIVYGDDQAFVEIRVGYGDWQTILGPYTNTSGGIWSPVYVDLTQYADSTVQIAFYFVSGNYNVSSGWYIDDVMILPDIVPVELTSFTTTLVNGDVKLEWLTATETNNQGFEIERRKENNEYQKIGYVPGHGTTTEAYKYSYIDSKVTSSNYFYRLKQIDFDGSFEYSKEVSVNISTPLKFGLKQNYPNPFNPATKINYEIPITSFVTLKIYGVLGNEVATLVNQEKEAGSYEVEFNASELSSGILSL